MNIQGIIENFKNNQSEIDEKVIILKSIYKNEEQLWNALEVIDPGIIISERVMNLLADSLQMVDDKKRVELFDLNDIKNIYQVLVQYYPNNIQYQIDLISFVYNVLDDEREAKNLINQTMKIIEDNRKCLLNFLEEMKDDRVV